MPLVTIDAVKGLFEQQGVGLSASSQATQTIEAGGEIDTSLSFVTKITSDGDLLQAAGDHVTLKAGHTDGQLLLLVNKGAHSIEFEHGHLAHALAGDAHPTLPTGSATLFLWNGAAWSATSQTLK